MFYTIYKTTNLIDGKIYIGKHQTCNLEDNYLGSGNIITYAIKKHGIENFTKEILYVFDNEKDMNLKEAELVTEEFCLREDTYNLCPGGKGGWGYVNQNNLSPRTLGKKFSQETKNKMSDSQKGFNNSQFGSMWITNGQENKKIKKEAYIPEGWCIGRKKTWKYGRVVDGSSLEN